MISDAMQYNTSEKIAAIMQRMSFNVVVFLQAFYKILYLFQQIKLYKTCILQGHYKIIG